MCSAQKARATVRVRPLSCLKSPPAGWSQVARAQIGTRGLVIAFDVLEMAPLPGVKFLQGDIRAGAAAGMLEQALAGRRVDLVLSDMSPNISGISMSDQARVMHLAELALEFSAQHLKPGGNLLVKVFQGAGFEEFWRAMRARFHDVVTRNPRASPGRSRGTVLL